MKIKNLYTANRHFPILSVIVAAICCLITVTVLIKPEWYPVLAWKYPADNIWQCFGGVFLHGTSGGSAAMAAAHLSANLLMFLPFSIMIEKSIGHAKFGFAFLISWLSAALAFMILAAAFSSGKDAYGAGLSGVSYSMITIGCAILIRIFLMDKKRFFRQPLAYVFLGGMVCELAMLNPYIAGIGSFILHLSGIFVGLILSIAFGKAIKESLIKAQCMSVS